MVYFGINQLFSESNGYKSLQIFFIQSNDKLKRFPFNLVEILKRRKIQIYLYFRNIVFPFPYNTQTFAQYERRERGKFSHPFKWIHSSWYSYNFIKRDDIKLENILNDNIIIIYLYFINNWEI